MRKYYPQIMVVVTSPKAKTEIRRQLLEWVKNRLPISGSSPEVSIECLSFAIFKLDKC